LKTYLLILLAAGVFEVLPVALCFADSPNYEAHCKEPLPEFTLGPNSHPTQDQESALCTCIWSNLNQSDRIISQNIREGRQSDSSVPGVQAFIAKRSVRSSFGPIDYKPCNGAGNDLRSTFAKRLTHNISLI
jgi:hypothetical protein